MALINCEAAIVPWGTKARFKKAKVGLVKKNPTNTSSVYFIVTFGVNDINKFPINPREIELLPAAIRFLDLSRDVFIRAPNDEGKLKPMLRKLRIIVEQDKLRKKGKGMAVDQTLFNIPSVDRVIGNNQELMPARTSAKIGDDASQTAVARLENKQLRSINVSGVSVLPSNLWLRDTLTELHLVKCNLKSIPTQIHKFGGTLRILDLSQNLITELPAPFCCHMTKLTRLDLSDNSLKKLPLEICFLNQLISLNLSKNQLNSLPSTFTNLIKIEELLLAGNKLKQLPAFRQIELRKLDVSHNPLDDSELMNESIGDDDSFSLSELATLKVVRSDSLFKLAHKTLPPVLYSRIQREVFKCFECNQLNLLPAIHISDQLDYVSQVETLQTSGNLKHGMTFVKSICRSCFKKHE